jgi:uncharacterized protein (TIGR02145 family)
MKVILPIIFGLVSLHFAVSQTVQLETKVFLEGPYHASSGLMLATDPDHFEPNQPFNKPPWNYSGGEVVSTLPNSNVVDWILVELRSSPGGVSLATPSTSVGKKAGLLLTDGSIVDLDGQSHLPIPVTSTDDLFVVVWHRNHLGIISPVILNNTGGVYPYDFRLSSSAAYGDTLALKEVSPGIWAMIGGDGEVSGVVDILDKDFWTTEAGSKGYLQSDFNLDGEVNNQDKNDIWLFNQGDSSHVTKEIEFICGDQITDIEGNVYNTVLIGTQCWMKENLKTTTYRNGTPIPNVTDNSTWANLTTGAYVWYNNDINWKDKYGALYNWYASVDGSGICPEGWHVPSQDNWTILTDFIGGTSSPTGQKLKSCRRVNSPLGGDCNTSTHPRWNEDTWSLHYGTDDYGFSGLPGGYRYALGSFNIMGFVGIWWTSTEVSSLNALAFSLVYNISHVNFFDESRKEGYSIRCLKGIPLNQPPNQPTNPSPEDGATNVEINTLLSWTCSDPDGDELHYKIYFGTDPTPELIFTNHPDTFYLPGLLAYNTTYYWKITAYDIHGDSTEGSIWSFTTEPDPWTCGDQISDIDGNTYNTVQIGNQCWMKENLKTATYRNGTPIPNVTNSSNWTSLSTGAYAWYDNDINWKDKYGALYNWYAVVDPIGLCPEGWHVPSHIEWTALTTFIGGASSPNGNKLKSCRMVNSPLGGDCNTSEHPRWNQGFLATDDYGFSGLPGGLRNETGLFYPVGYYGSWWTTSGYSATESYYRGLGWDHGSFTEWYFHRRGGLSVRCLKDD